MGAGSAGDDFDILCRFLVGHFPSDRVKSIVVRAIKKMGRERKIMLIFYYYEFTVILCRIFCAVLKRDEDIDVFDRLDIWLSWRVVNSFMCLFVSLRK